MIPRGDKNHLLSMTLYWAVRAVKLRLVMVISAMVISASSGLAYLYHKGIVNPLNQQILALNQEIKTHLARIEQANDRVKLAEAMSCLDVAKNLMARQEAFKITDQQNGTQIDSSVDCDYILPPASAEAIEQINAYGEIIIDKRVLTYR